ncbi:MAG: hypothetical protein MK135_14235 [Polyangiaceae bacterium]|nr:hypothetical protein [Polyangiaceae bacterium]
MSLDYMEEMVDRLGASLFKTEKKERVIGELPDGDCVSHCFEVHRPEERLLFEAVDHPQEGMRYFLEVAEFHGLSSFRLPLDSWKIWPDRLEFKYYSLPENGRAVSFILDLPGLDERGLES